MLRLAPLRVVLWCLLYCGARSDALWSCAWYFAFCFDVMYLLCCCVVLARQMACRIAFLLRCVDADALCRVVSCHVVASSAWSVM